MWTIELRRIGQVPRCRGVDGEGLRLGPLRRLGNIAQTLLVRTGLAPRFSYILTTVGRKTGKRRSTPVTVLEHREHRWLVSPYGTVGWVHNARAAGRVTLNRGWRSREVRVTEVAPEEAAPVLRHYLNDVPIVRPYFDVGVDSPLEDFAAEASQHPVFRIGDE